GAVLVWLRDLGLECDGPFKARREIGHLALLFRSADRVTRGRQAAQTPLSLRPFPLTSHTAVWRVSPRSWAYLKLYPAARRGLPSRPIWWYLDASKSGLSVSIQAPARRT